MKKKHPTRTSSTTIPSRPDNTNSKRFVFAGPRRHKDEVGGIVFLFEDLIKTVGHQAKIFDTNAKNYSSSIIMILQFIRCCAVSGFREQEISLHGTARDYQYLGSILYLFHFLIGLQYHTRKFAGNFDDIYQNMPPFWRFMVMKFLKKSRANFFETQYLLHYFSTLNPHTYWFPNYRSLSHHLTSPQFNGTFVFMGHVKREKGIDLLLSVSTLLPIGWTIDVYGELLEYRQAEFVGNIRYCGIIDTHEVPHTLSQYSALLLPSLREGYPGIILEAYSVGLPVVVNDLPSLREIVSYESGEIIEHMTPQALLSSMKNLADHYGEKREGARNCFKTFERSTVLQKYLALIGWSDNRKMK